MTRIVTKYNLEMKPEQEVEMSVAGVLLGLTIEDNTLKLLVDQESSPLRTRNRAFYIVRPERDIPELALRYLGHFALDGSIAFLYTEADDTSLPFVPDAPLAHWSDIHAIHLRLADLERT
ncbi:hypothetical protein NG829_08530 [Xanthomonas sacchari]|uniref:hypothetical protein n=1 Tax=Xanthomonas sacchari TaxID=56458 RepID=UPI00225E006F|nr:hypothetical protein [Xanthomonas sacchari]UYK82322.1 hypothetical protein NG829_08530 [Xanthomonas sacchari]